MSADILFEADRCLEAMRELRKVEGGTLLDLRNARLADWEHTSKSEVNARTTMWTVPLLPPWERLQAMDDAIAELGQTLGPHQPHNADMTRLLLLRIAQEPESPYRERKYKEILSVFGDRDCKLAMDTKVECYMQLCNIYLSRSDGEGAYVCVEKLNEIATTPFAKTIAFHQQAGVYLHHQKVYAAIEKGLACLREARNMERFTLNSVRYAAKAANIIGLYYQYLRNWERSTAWCTEGYNWLLLVVPENDPKAFTIACNLIGIRCSKLLDEENPADVDVNEILVTIHELLHRFKDDGGEDAKQSLENMKQFLTRLLNNDQT